MSNETELNDITKNFMFYLDMITNLDHKVIGNYFEELKEAINSNLNYEIFTINYIKKGANFHCLYENKPIYILSNNSDAIQTIDYKKLLSIIEMYINENILNINGEEISHLFDTLNNFVYISDFVENPSFYDIVSFKLLIIRIDKSIYLNMNYACIDPKAWGYDAESIKKYINIDLTPHSFFESVAKEFVKAFSNSNKDINWFNEEGIIQRAGDAFISELFYLISGMSKNPDKEGISYNFLDLSNAINAISSLKYEKNIISSNLLLVNPSEITNFDIDIPINKADLSLSNYKMSRKLLEVAKVKLYLVTSGTRIIGYVSKNKINPEFNICFPIEINGMHRWKILSSAFQPLIENDYNRYIYPKHKITQDEFRTCIQTKS